MTHDQLAWLFSVLTMVAIGLRPGVADAAPFGNRLTFERLPG